MNVTVEIPENIYQNVAQLAAKTNRQIDEIILDKLEEDFSVEDDGFEQDVSEWSDEDVLALANLKMPEAQSERMSELLDRGQAGQITNVEKSELQMYFEIFNNANFRKSCGIVEAVKRNLISSPKDLR